MLPSSFPRVVLLILLLVSSTTLSMSRAAAGNKAQSTVRALLQSKDYASLKLPELIAFDLDGTIWSPEMYELYGGGAPFAVPPPQNRSGQPRSSSSIEGSTLLDRSGTPVRLLGITSEILQDLNTNPALQRVKLAWVSCTDEPVWAEECLQKFTTSDGMPIGRIIAERGSSQIFKANKQQHFRNLKSLYPHIEYENMLFFDNEQGNCATVSKLGVKCIYAGNGMTFDAWVDGLALFN